MRIKFVYEGHRIKVKVTGAKKCKIPYSCNVKLRSAIIPILQKIQPRCLRAAWGFPLRWMVWSPSLSRDWKWPRVSKYTHCQVIYLRWEGNLVFLLLFFIHKHSDYNWYWWMQTFTHECYVTLTFLHVWFLWLLWCGYAGSSCEVKIETDSNDAVKIETEADSNDIIECQYNDGPSISMFGLFSVCMPWLIHC